MHRLLQDRYILALSIVVTIAGSGLAYLLAGRPGAIGIDDANIVQRYARNLAAGMGYVYQAGGERVEGSTSFLWTIVNALCYVAAPGDNTAILLISFAFTIGTVFLTQRCYSLLVGRLDLSPICLVVPVVFDLAYCSFFIWSVWSLLETAIWSFALVLLIERLLALLLKGWSRGRMAVATAAGAALVLCRPEGLPIAVGLLALAAVLDRDRKSGRSGSLSGFAISIALVIATFLVLTGWRYAYFGFPYPNTYYAKVSSDWFSNALIGAGYLSRFLAEMPFIAVHVIGWMTLLVFSLRCLRQPSPIDDVFRAALLLCASVFGILALYIMLGGDHFALFRFYQPILLLLPLPLALGVGLALREIRRLDEVWRSAAITSGIVSAGTVVLLGILYTGQEAKREFHEEFLLAATGQRLGLALNEISGWTAPISVGALAAGGISLTFSGRLYDLLGLNWVAMAHADPIKTGLRNHGSFSKRVFWEAKPDFVAPHLFAEEERGPWLISPAFRNTLKGLPFDPDFQDSYEPVVVDTGLGRVRAFASRAWTTNASAARFIRLPWSAVIPIDRPS